MIYFIDNFISWENLNKLDVYLNNFKEVDTGEKKFWVMDVPNDILNIFCERIKLIEGKTPKVLLSMFRISDNERDIDWRIHCDGIINNDIPKRAAIFYISQSDYDSLHGTAFWKHKKYDLEALHPLREYFSRVLDFIGKTNSQIAKDLGHRKAEHCFYVSKKMIDDYLGHQKANHSFRFGSSQFGLCTRETYQELIDVFKDRDWET